MPRTGDRRPGPGLRVLAKFVENGVCVVRLEQVGGLVDHGPVALIGMNTRVDARDVPPTTVIEDIEFVQAQVRRFAEAQLAPA